MNYANLDNELLGQFFWFFFNVIFGFCILTFGGFLMKKIFSIFK